MKQQKYTLVLLIIMLCIIAISGTLAITSSVNADDNPAIDDTINITVDSACTIGQTVLQSSESLNPGGTKVVGSSRIAAYCNDNEGYAIYAIGYTNGEYGNTNLVSTDGNHTIPTGTSGSNSFWNMKLTQGTATGTTSYLPTMVNEFTTSATIPNDYTKVAYRDSSTIPQSQDPTKSGSYFTTTYAAHVSTTQPAGIYNGQVQYVMVHPSSASAPEKPTMQNTTLIKSKLVNIGDTIQAVDNRDGKKYWLAKLADGNIWMTQNLDFDIDSTKTYTSADTDLPSGINWTPVRSTTTSTTWDTNTAGLTTPYSYDPGDLYWNGNIDTSYDGTLNNRTVTNPSFTPGGTHYHTGNYYNWTAAVAMNDSSAYTTNQQDVNQSICPAGWSLPTYSGNKSYQNLINAESLTAGASGNIQNAPVYFVYGGWWQGTSNSVGRLGYYKSSSVGSSDFSHQLAIYASGSLFPQTGVYKYAGSSIRCVIR